VDLTDPSAAKIGEHVGKATLSQRQFAAVQQHDRALGEKTDRLNREAADRAKLSPDRQKLADAMNTDAAKRHAFVQHLAELGRHEKLDLAHMMRSRHPLGVPPSALVNNSRSHSFERHGDTFNIHGTDAKSGMDQAVKVSARREGQDRIRYGQGPQQ